MARNESTNRRDEIECPYCGNIDGDTCEVEHGDYECPKCGKKSSLEIDTHIYYKLEPNCEMNGEEHAWRKDKRFQECYKCYKCGKLELIK